MASEKDVLVDASFLQHGWTFSISFGTTHWITTSIDSYAKTRMKPILLKSIVALGDIPTKQYLAGLPRV